MDYRTLLKANIKRQKGSLYGVFFADAGCFHEWAGCFALRQLNAGMRRYVEAGMIAVLQMFFAALVGRDTWLGPDGQGKMDALHALRFALAALVGAAAVILM